VRILHLIQELGIGGAERIVTVLVAGARRVGHDVAVAAADGPTAASLDVPIFPLPMIRRRMRSVPAAARAVGRAVRAWSPDIVHCHNPGMAVAFAFGTVRRARCCAVVSIQGVSDSDYRHAARLLRWIGMPAVACSPAVAALLQEHGVAASTIVNGIGAAARPAARATLEADWPCLRGGRRLLVAAGRLVPQKNFAFAVETLARIPDAALIMKKQGFTELAVLADLGPWPWAGYSTSDAHLASRRDKLKRWTRAMVKSLQFMQTRREETYKIAQAEFNHQRDITEGAANICIKAIDGKIDYYGEWIATGERPKRLPQPPDHRSPNRGARRRRGGRTGSHDRSSG
jgi:glycosyltransferase involved in cell wall biosynthesis